MLKFYMELSEFIRKSSQQTAFHIALIALLGFLAYSNTLNAPFQWDEGEFIVDNPIVKDLSYFLHPSKAEGLMQSDTFKMRYIGYLTFALNYKLNGLDVRGYHAVNITIHILNAILVYFLVVLTFKSPFLEESKLKEQSRYIALFSALLFVSHPIQTEAVTYVMQRLASLCAFFYLLSLVLYIEWRLNSVIAPKTAIQKPYKWIPASAGMTKALSTIALYLMSLLSAVLAMKTKENAFTLPLIIALYEFSFFRGPVKKRIIYLIPILLTMLIIPLSLLGGGEPVGLDAKLRVNTDITRLDYLLTEFKVLITYIRLLFLPINQNINYDYRIFTSFFHPQVFMSFIFLFGIAGVGVYLYLRSRSKPELRVAAYGVFWFFITLSVESSIIPIGIVISEYRVYLPSVGFFMAAAAGAVLLLKRFRTEKIKAAAIMVFLPILFALSISAYMRNAVWGSNVSLWEDTVKKSPRKTTVHNNLGIAYDAKGFTDKAIAHFEAALKLNPTYAEAYNNLGVAYKSKGMFDKAIAHFEAALKLNPTYVEAYNNLGVAYKSKGMFDKAIEYYLITLKLKPNTPGAYNNLGDAYYSLGLNDKAIEHYRIALKLKPDSAEAYNNLGAAYHIMGLNDKAIEHYRIALKIEPSNVQAHYNLGLIYFKQELMTEAREEFETVLRLNPGHHRASNYLEILK